MGESNDLRAASSRPNRRVLLAEDAPGDVLLLREAFRSRASQVVLESVPDGLAALRRLEGDGEYARLPEPDLVLLDLSLPHLDGRALLAKLRSRPRRLPVVVLTGSQRRTDRSECLRLGAVSYVVKPMYYGEWLALVDQLVHLLEPRSTPTGPSTPSPRDRALA